MLICWGERDFVFDHHFLAEWRRRFPEAEVHRFPDAGHYVLEDAGDGDRAAGPRFLATSSARTGRMSHEDRRARPRIGIRRTAVNIAARVWRDGRERSRRRWPSSQPHGRDRHGRIRYRHFTYRELNAGERWPGRGLEQIGIRRGMRTVLMVTPSLEFFALTFALFKVGAVVVLIDPGMGIEEPRRLSGRGGAGGVHRHSEGASGSRRCSAGAAERSASASPSGRDWLGRLDARAGAPTRR